MNDLREKLTPLIKEDPESQDSFDNLMNTVSQLKTEEFKATRAKSRRIAIVVAIYNVVIIGALLYIFAKSQKHKQEVDMLNSKIEQLEGRSK